MTDTSIICSYLVPKWVKSFENTPGFQGVLVKEEFQPEQVVQARKFFHRKYAGQKHLTEEVYQALINLYPEIDQTEKAMIAQYGISSYSTTEHPQTVFLGDNLNGNYSRNWLMKAAQDSPPLIFCCVSQILKPWWIELTKSQLFNCHTAVLPYARGMHSIENMAIFKDINKFKQAAGITIHYIDEGVDTGSIIRSERIIDPFRFNSIWELKGYTYMKEFELYVQTAQEILGNNETIPAGVSVDPKLQGPNFIAKNFTPEKKKQAEEAYLIMKNSWRDLS
ncbi:formyltransferase family protein [Calothrix rhizosoleniae]|uniref:formyltransferase family protein n=1 Tax=Calothrix rhizosoleniae TaxID=888997 RepID=UPI001F476F40|nr:formyltransferase family protein [Calothrix rhizosoleniae]